MSKTRAFKPIYMKNSVGKAVKLTETQFISGRYRIARMVFWNVTPSIDPQPFNKIRICVHYGKHDDYRNAYCFFIDRDKHLHIGCYRFSKRNTKTLLKWAGYNVEDLLNGY
jgi:hypothetical protein